MRIALLAMGTHGDVQPYVALAAGLQAAGHRVRLVTHTPFRAFVEAYGLDFAAIDGNPQTAFKSEEATKILNPKATPLTIYRTIHALCEQYMPHLLEQLWQGAQDADAILSPIMEPAGRHIAEALQVPHFWLSLQPMARTKAFPSTLVPAESSLGDMLNRTSHIAIEQMLLQPMRQQVNRFRRERLGLKPYPMLGPLREIIKRREHVLCGYSRAVVPKPRDWGRHLHLTGYWFLPTPDDWAPPDELENFLRDGTPPVSIGFGSMHAMDTDTVTHTVLDALAAVGERGVLMSGWGALGSAELPAHVLKIEHTPHDWLFPRMRAVVHHGGAGTTAAGLRAGVPSVLVPFMVDQRFWGARVKALGVGPRPIPLAQLNADRLAAALTRAVHDDAMRARAERLATQLSAENGVQEAVTVFHRELERRTRRRRLKLTDSA